MVSEAAPGGKWAVAWPGPSTTGEDDAMRTDIQRDGLAGRALALALLLVLLGATFDAAVAAEEIGRVSRIQGTAEAFTEGQRRPLRLLTPVHQGDVIGTGPAARLEIVFDDGSLLTLGERAELTLDDFVYRPGGAGDRFAVSVTGAFRFVSGQLADSPSRRARIRTPVATLSIRGTDVWGGPVNGHFGVFLLEGRVEVSNAAGRVVLQMPGEGTNIEGPGAAPGAVTRWPEDKVQRAIATVSFR